MRTGYTRDWIKLIVRVVKIIVLVQETHIKSKLHLSSLVPQVYKLPHQNLSSPQALQTKDIPILLDHSTLQVVEQ